MRSRDRAGPATGPGSTAVADGADHAGTGPPAPDDPGSVGGTARDSMLVAAGTALARITGVVRVLAVGAVLGPTFFGNAYQVTNSLPNLIYYGFLAGSLVSSLLVPALVRFLDAGRPDRAAAMSGGFLGVFFTGGAVVLPVFVLVVPWLMRVSSSGTAAGSASEVDRQAALARVLVVMTVPQVFLYAVAGTAAAVLYAHRRFVLAALAPVIENVGVITVLGLVALRYGAASDDDTTVPLAELVLLGLGSTGAVALHAAVQWWGAHRCGVVVRPRRGWREPEVRAALRRALHAVTQAGMLATQTLVLLLVASRVPGGAVAFQIALNFYSLPIALIATPVGLALLPRLARLDQAGADGEFSDTFRRGLMLGLFVAAPAAAGYVALAVPLAHLVGVGQMSTSSGYEMVARALTALAVGLLGQTVFFITTQASYARNDTRTPLRSMALQCVVCIGLCAAAVAVADGGTLLSLVGAAYAVASLVGGAHLLVRVAGGSTPLLWRIWRPFLRVVVGAGVMLLPVYSIVGLWTALDPGRVGSLLAVLCGSLVGLLSYGLVQALLRGPELTWLRSGLGASALDG
jgi:putative peptidoglycan lipid II flippase